MEVAGLLQQWKLPILVETFQGFSLERFGALSQDSIYEKIPDYDLRQEFIKNFDQWRRQEVEGEQTNRELLNLDNNLSADNTGNVPLADGTIDTRLFWEINPLLGDHTSLLPALQTANIVEALTGPNNSLVTSNQSHSMVTESTAGSTSSSSVKQDATPGTSTLTVENTTESDIPKDLKAYLLTDQDGITILRTYQETGELTPRLRTLLVQRVIARETSQRLRTIDVTSEQLDKFHISTEHFLSLAEDIGKLFPTESPPVYYSPYTQTEGFKVLASGKLWEHFNYVKTKLRKAHLLKAKKESKINVPSRELTDADETTLGALREKISPWEEVVREWQATFELRRLKFQKEETSVEQYFEEYKCLQLEGGKNLLTYDFEQLHPGKSNGLLSKWERLRTSITDLLQGSYRPKDADALALLQQLPSLCPARQDAIILYLLPRMIAPTQISVQPPKKKSRKQNPNEVKAKNKKPSVLETQEAFILHVQNATDVEEALQQKRDKAESSGETLQPLCVFVGPLNDVTATYVIINDVRYRATTPLEAVDLAFKTFFAVDCAYPRAAFQVWLLLQRVAYEIITPQDKLGTPLKLLIGKIQA